MLERVKDHNGTDSSSHIFKYCVAADHQYVSRGDLKSVGRNCRYNKRKRKITEALLIKNLKPLLNEQWNQLHLSQLQLVAFLGGSDTDKF